MTERLYSTQQVAQLLGTSPKTVADWIRQGRLQAEQLPGGRLCVGESALARFLESQGIDLEGLMAQIVLAEAKSRRLEPGRPASGNAPPSTAPEFAASAAKPRPPAPAAKPPPAPAEAPAPRAKAPPAPTAVSAPAAKAPPAPAEAPATRAKAPPTPGAPCVGGGGGMPTPLLRGHVPGMGDSMPSERRAGHATLDEQGLPQNLGTPAVTLGRGIVLPGARGRPKIPHSTSRGKVRRGEVSRRFVSVQGWLDWRVAWPRAVAWP
jgi:excisionase family DNA binding protein